MVLQEASFQVCLFYNPSMGQPQDKVTYPCDCAGVHSSHDRGAVRAAPKGGSSDDAFPEVSAHHRGTLHACVLASGLDPS